MSFEHANPRAGPAGRSGGPGPPAGRVRLAARTFFCFFMFAGKSVPTLFTLPFILKQYLAKDWVSKGILLSIPNIPAVWSVASMFCSEVHSKSVNKVLLNKSSPNALYGNHRCCLKNSTWFSLCPSFSNFDFVNFFISNLSPFTTSRKT